MLRLIDGYSEDETVIWTGQSFPTFALIRDGRKRFLLVPDRTVSVSIYESALSMGAESAYRPDGKWIPIREFEDLGILQSGSEPSYEVPEFIWHLPHGLDVFVPQDGSPGQQEVSKDGQSDTQLDHITEVGDQTTEPDQVPFVHLHCHSEYSPLDGLASVEEMIAVAKSQGHTALAITDHGGNWGHPEFGAECEKEGIKPIFGMEGYLVDDRFSREGDYMHITLWAMNDIGLKNLGAITTEGYRDGLYSDHPRFDWDTLERHAEGVIVGSGCLRGPLSYPVKDHNYSKAIVNSERLKKIFGDRYYIEIHANLLDIQVEVNNWLVKHAREFEIPMIVAVDSHYATQEERDDHQIWIHMSVGKDVSQEITLFGGNQDYHMASAKEIITRLDYLDDDVVRECFQNTLKIADLCDAKLIKREGLPVYSHGDDAEQKDIDKLFELIAQNWDSRTKGKPYTQEQAYDRLAEEADIIVPKGYAGYYLMNSDIVSWAKDHGVMVGPGRGSGAGSQIAYDLRITEVDPLENDLLLARFMTKGRKSLPDFDIDYPSSKKQMMLQYAQSRWGRKHVAAVGTVIRIRNKAAFKDTARAIKSRLPEGYFPDVEQISKIIDAAESNTAGLGLSFDELMEHAEEELAPFRAKYPDLFRLARKFRGRVKTYSKHAAGLVIDPQYDLENTLPMMASEDGETLVTQYDMVILEKLGFIKFDFLNLRNLDTIQLCIDLVREQTGEEIDVNSWREEYRDADVFDDISNGWTLGMFQLETPLGTRTVKQLKPRTLADLSDCITLGRPGPIRSGLDKTYFRRREGKEPVTYADPRLEKVLSKTYGTMIYQEDIMGVTIALANYDDEEADYVRKILGKKKPEEAAKEGKKFISRAVENGTDPKVAEALWSQMEEFSRYSFNRAHAFSYAVLAYWTAWLKRHYPVQYATAILSTIDQDEVPLWVTEARRLGFKVLPPDINDSREGFTNTETEVRYGFLALKGIGGECTKSLIENQPYKSFDDFMERRDSEKVDRGQVKILVHVGAFDSLEPNRRALEKRLEEEELKAGERCVFYQIQPRNKYNNLPCKFDWDSEEPLRGKTGKILKNQKPPPKICSKACRHWTPREPPTSSAVTPYTDEEIREIEMESLGIYLSSSPFDILDEEDLKQLAAATDLVTEPNGQYTTALLFQKIKPHTTKRGDLMAFVTAETPSGTIDMSVFSNTLAKYKTFIQPGKMALALVEKNDKGVTLQFVEPL